MDVYTPPGKGPFPAVLVFHGGGWLVNDRTVMNDLSRYLCSRGGFVVFNSDYRLLGDNGNATTLPEIIGDCFGALAWVKAHAAEYLADPHRLAVTGDSAGGHLAAMVALAAARVGEGIYAPPEFAYRPSWLPEGKRAADLDYSVRAVVFDYGISDVYAQSASGHLESITNVFWGLARVRPRGLFGPGVSAAENPDWYRASSPLYLIPQASERKLPPFYCAVGSADLVVSPQSVRKFVSALKAAGQPAEFWVYPGRGHAYLDSGSSVIQGRNFNRDAPPALDRVIRFLRHNLSAE
jgi:acetyl esterase/lipase